MINRIFNATMMKYLKENQITLHDGEIAAIIWNHPVLTREQKLNDLEELRKSTKDFLLKEQIEERLEYEEMRWNIFLTNSNDQYIYGVYEAESNISCSFFHEYEQAYEYAMDYNKYVDEPCYIKKDIIRKVYLTEDDDSEEYGTVILNKEGDVVSFQIWTEFLSHEKWEKFTDPEYTDRFENLYMELSHPYKVGDIVIDLNTGRQGVIREIVNKNTFADDIAEGNVQFLCFEDNHLFISFISEDGRWYHDHISPFYMEKDVPNDNSYKGKALAAMSSYIKGNQSALQTKLVLSTTKAYADSCKNKTLFDEVQIEQVEDLFY